MVELSTWMSLLASVASVTALVLTGFAIAAYARERRARFLFIALAFAALTTRAGLVSASVILDRPVETLLAWTLGLDASALVLLYLAAVR